MEEMEKSNLDNLQLYAFIKRCRKNKKVTPNVDKKKLDITFMKQDG